MMPGILPTTADSEKSALVISAIFAVILAALWLGAWIESKWRK